ncbi:MAG TPA: molybdenum cofactor guanylyltransferase [Edaphobacter sp.]|nr:molybdenum cofactor guanylyltransferase [Edaphobacter sp.]
MKISFPMDVGGYVLAGGKSLRMGRDKVLLALADKPLAQHAVAKLQRICTDVHLLGNRNELAVYAPLVHDVHEGRGPLSGIEAALEHSQHNWNLFMPVDMPFLPTAFLAWWMPTALKREKEGTRMAMLTVDGRPQPALCLLHKEVLPFVKQAMDRGAFKLFRVFEETERELSTRSGSSEVFFNLPWTEAQEFSVLAEENNAWCKLTKQQNAARRLWFANLNTPEEFAEAQSFANALDT